MSPGIPVTAELLQQDPLLLFPRYAMGLSSLQSNSDITLEDGFATLRDEQGISTTCGAGTQKQPLQY